jgi:[acyl-carrier-protein] S-malonyltransferase
MGRRWSDDFAIAAETFADADRILGQPISESCFDGPAERLNRTDVSQPAIFTCSVASARALAQRDGKPTPTGAAGLSLGEYTALHLAGVFDFEAGLKLVARRGALMQEASEASDGSMVAVIGADEVRAQAICDEVAKGEIIVCANLNAPGQIVLSGDRSACERALGVAKASGLRATALAVAGAFHSPLMQPAADRMAEALAEVVFQPPRFPVWSNVTARPHDPHDMELLRLRLVEQIVTPVRWRQTCEGLLAEGHREYDELAPGTVLRGIMRRIDHSAKVSSHDEP